MEPVAGRAIDGERPMMDSKTRTRLFDSKLFRSALPALLALACAAPEVVIDPVEVPAKPQNILLLFADDMRPDTIAAWGNDAIATPNLDRLVEDGFSFRQAYNLGSVHGAVCMPSRAMLHTGLPYFGMNLSTFNDHSTLGQLLQQADYHSFGTGKWHNGRDTFSRSFEEGQSIFFGGMSDHNYVPLTDLSSAGYGPDRTGDAHSSELFADAAVSFLDNYKEDDPFFCYVAFTAPHDPRDPPAEFMHPYRDVSPPLPANFLPQHPIDNGFLRVRDEKLAAWPRTEHVVGEQLAEYYALIAHLDSQIGRILDALESCGRLDNTLVVFAADHGLAMGSHGLLGKQNLYEHSIGMPLVLSGPGVPRGGTTNAQVYLHDVFATVLTRAGVEVPAGRMSRDLMPICTGDTSTVRTQLGFSMGSTIRALRDDHWKLIRYPKIDRTQLFDLSQDPDELNDLAALPEHRDRIDVMLSNLRVWQNTVADTQTLTATELMPAEVDLTGAERNPDRWQPQWIREKYFDPQ
ncbi:MAG: arylsulfatase A-like enzyme [Planctomycetota bacterium]